VSGKVDKPTLEALSKEGIQGRDPGTLPDLLTIQIEGETPVQRWESYLSQTGNPYCFRVGKIPVRLLFHNEEKPLYEKLKSYFMTLKNNDI